MSYTCHYSVLPRRIVGWVFSLLLSHIVLFDWFHFRCYHSLWYFLSSCPGFRTNISLNRRFKLVLVLPFDPGHERGMLRTHQRLSMMWFFYFARNLELSAILNYLGNRPRLSGQQWANFRGLDSKERIRIGRLIVHVSLKTLADSTLEKKEFI